MKKDSLLPKRCQRLKDLRGTKTQKEMSILLDVTEKTYRSWENGEYRKGHIEKTYPQPDLDRLIKMSEIFHCSIDYLLCRSDCTSVDNHYISQKTGLSDSAVNILSTHKYFTPRYIKSLNILIEDIADGPAARSFIDIFSNYILFNTDSSEKYALTKNGDIVKNPKPMSIDEDGKRFFDASKIYFDRKQLGQMYIMEMEDVLKSIKESYMDETNKKAPDKEK